MNKIVHDCIWHPNLVTQHNNPGYTIDGSNFKNKDVINTILDATLNARSPGNDMSLEVDVLYSWNGMIAPWSYDHWSYQWTNEGFKNRYINGFGKAYDKPADRDLDGFTHYEEYCVNFGLATKLQFLNETVSAPFKKLKQDFHAIGVWE